MGIDVKLVMGEQEDIAIRKSEEKQTAEEQEILKMIAEEDLKNRISYIFGDMNYYDINQKKD